MPDILSSLAAANGSHESFHSSHTSPDTAAAIDQGPANTYIAALQAAGLPVHDVDAYLDDPENQALLASSSKSKKTVAATQGSSSVNEPILLGGPKTSHHVKTLYEICSPKGLQPEFEFEGDEHGFSGWVSINGETIATDERWPNKKAAKEALAKRAIPLAKSMTVTGAKPAPAAESKVNWIGKLLEYHNSVSPTQGPIYQEYAVGGSFACTCVIPGHPTPFGGTSTVFPNKKAARVNAAREAMEFLITAGLTEPDGSLKTKKKAKLGAAVRIEKDRLGVKKDTTFAQRVNDICPILGLSAPEYRITPLSADAPNIVSGAAYFRSEPLFPKPLGEVRNVYGKKNAKEECAKGVWMTLSELAKKRGVKVSEEDDEDVDISTS